jgi:DNA-binding MarR family transcriptional regulator
MTDAGGFSDPKRHQRDAELDPVSRLALIMEQAERLAEQASTGSRRNRALALHARTLIAARTARRRYFAEDLFSDPAWDILLELYALRCEQQRTSVSKLAMAAGIPVTTALRWLERLNKDGLIVREPDPLDGRRVWVALSDDGFAGMEGYFTELANPA